VKHNHDIDGKLHDDCTACDYTRALTSPRASKVQREIDQDIGGIMKTALKAKP
jgi:hypothetical protein